MHSVPGKAPSKPSSGNTKPQIKYYYETFLDWNLGLRSGSGTASIAGVGDFGDLWIFLAANMGSFSHTLVWRLSHAPRFFGIRLQKQILGTHVFYIL